MHTQARGHAPVLNAELAFGSTGIPVLPLTSAKLLLSKQVGVGDVRSLPAVAKQRKAVWYGMCVRNRCHMIASSKKLQALLHAAVAEKQLDYSNGNSDCCF